MPSYCATCWCAMWLGVPIKGNQRARTSLRKNEWLVKSLLHPEPTVLIIIEFFFFWKRKRKKIQVSKLNSEIHLEAELEVQWLVYPDFTNRSSDILSLFGGTGGGQQTVARRPACKFRILELPEPVCTWSASSKWGDTSPCGIST